MTRRGHVAHSHHTGVADENDLDRTNTQTHKHTMERNQITHAQPDGLYAQHFTRSFIFKGASCMVGQWQAIAENSHGT